MGANEEITMKDSLSKRGETSTRLQLVNPEVLRDRMREIHDTIARHAYLLFEFRGREHGRAMEDWYAAEREVLHLCRRDLKESAEEIVLTFELGGSFNANQLNVCVEPYRVTVSGERNIDFLRGDSSGTHEERRPQHIFRTLDLPSEVDPAAAVATLSHETIEVVMPKTGVGEHEDRKAKVASSTG